MTDKDLEKRIIHHIAIAHGPQIRASKILILLFILNLLMSGINIFLFTKFILGR